MTNRLSPAHGLLLALMMTGPSAPAAAQGIEVVETAFQQWLAQHKVSQAVLAVSRERKLVLARGYGGTDPGAAVLIASLSKAITGACVGTLVDAGKLAFGTRVGTALAAFFERHGEPADTRIKDATIADLLAHRAGFDRARSTAALFEHLRGASVRDEAMTPLLVRTLRENLVETPGRVFAYTNTAYLMLGVIIEQASGRSYEEYCRAAVLQPVGVDDGRLDPLWGRLLSSFGGWRLTGPQYLRFLEVFANDSTVLGPNARGFLADGEGKWVSDRRDVYYALGTYVRPTPDGRNVWHGGSHTVSVNNPYNFNLRESIGTYAVWVTRGFSWFAYCAPSPGAEAAVQLDSAIVRAIVAVRAWPTDDLYRQFGLR